MFFENFKTICEKRGTTPTAVLKELGYSTSKVTAWKKGSVPKSDMLHILAEHLQVGVSELFGTEDTYEKLEIHDDLKNLQIAFNRQGISDLSQDEVDDIAALVRSLRESGVLKKTGGK